MGNILLFGLTWAELLTDEVKTESPTSGAQMTSERYYFPEYVCMCVKQAC